MKEDLIKIAVFIAIIWAGFHFFNWGKFFEPVTVFFQQTFDFKGAFEKGQQAQDKIDHWRQ